MDVNLLILKVFEKYARKNTEKNLPKQWMLKQDFIFAANVIIEQMKKEKK